jgi:CUG-BP- and ETR3-like factor
MRLFVGQIPREWTETDIAKLFSTFGELNEITILRHPDNFASKGCAFVTFVHESSALAAIEQLHDKYSPSEGRKIQVRDSCAPRTTTDTGRLYCSNLAETTTGNQLFDLFSQVGRVLSVSILTTPFNKPKCSCLVEMATKQDAQTVIDQFNGKIRLPNAHLEMTVTWARNTGSKNKLTPTVTAPHVFSASPLLSGQPHQQPAFLPPQVMASHQPQAASYVPQAHHQPYITTPPVPEMYSPMFSMPYYPAAAQPQQAYYSMPQMMAAYEEPQVNVEEEKSDEELPPPPPLAVSPRAVSQSQLHPQVLAAGTVLMDAPPAAAGMQYQMYYPAGTYIPATFAIPVAHHHMPPQSPLLTPRKSFARRRSSSQSIISSPSPTSRYREGPLGSNLFVKNFPLDWERKDLFQLFEPFGEILSCNIFYDKVTGKSRGFGFVSFSNKDFAAAAIQNLNGKEFGTEKIVVELKSKELASVGSSISVLDGEPEVEAEVHE